MPTAYRSSSIASIAVVTVLTVGSSSAADTALTFNRDIRPILSEKCFFCHGFDPKKREGDLRLDEREDAVQAKAIVPGKSSESELITRILTSDEDDLMPPKKSHKSLSAVEKDILRRWIDQGAPYEKHWAFELPQKAALPPVKASSWVRNPVDAFVLAKLEANGLAPNAEADRRTLARRVWLDVTGLPPSPKEVEAFVSDTAPQAYERLVKRLMDTPHWGEHRARYWLDAARYADTHGIHHDAYREIWPYRDWVVSAFNQNMRFDAFTVEQIAGDLLPKPTREQLIATGFHRCNMTTAEGGTIADENLALYANDRVTTTAWVWLGLTANCAACHDHKFDPITTKDFYAMAAFFRNTTQSHSDGNAKDPKPVVYLPQKNDESRLAAMPKLIADATAALATRKREGTKEAESWLASVTPATFGVSTKGKVDAIDASKSFSIAARVKPAKDGIIAGGLFVQGKRFGLSIGKTVVMTSRDVLNPGKEQLITAVFDGKDGVLLYLDGKDTPTVRNGKLTTTAALEGVTEVRRYSRAFTKDEAAALFDETALRVVLSKDAAKRTAKQKADLTAFFFRAVDAAAVQIATKLEALNAEEAAIKARSVVSHIQEEKTAEPMANILIRGDYAKVGEKVTPAGFSALHEMEPTAPKNRLGLAQWLVSPGNPLTARVTVNRYWQELFGVGLVRTAEDFGSQGELPVNQALLDWLAVEFRESGWDVKKLFTLMLTSATYRQQAVSTPEKLARDPQNRLLSRGPRFRMDAEMVRDYALAASGTLVSKLGGPGTKPYQPANLWEIVGLHGARFTQDKGENLYRRTLYTFWKRQAPYPNLEAFNAPSREVCVVRRERTNTPLQALVTLNDPQFVEAARRLAESVVREKRDRASIIAELAQRILLRPLTDAENKIVTATATDLENEFQSAPDRAKAFLAIGDTKPDPALPAVQVATFGMIASQLLNLDETLNK